MTLDKMCLDQMASDEMSRHFDILPL